MSYIVDAIKVIERYKDFKVVIKQWKTLLTDKDKQLLAKAIFGENVNVRVTREKNPSERKVVYTRVLDFA